MAVSLTARATTVVSTHFMVMALAKPQLIALTNMGAAGVNLLASLLAMSIIAAAVRRGGGARLGGDEVRLFILSLLVALLVAAILLLAIAIGAAVGALNGLETSPNAAVMLGSLGLGAILVLGLVSRLWLAGPMSVQDGRLRFMASWRLTRGRWWKVFSAFLISLLMAGALVVLGGRALMTVFTMLKLDFSIVYDQALLTAFKGAIKPAGLAMVLLQGILLGLAMIIHLAPAALIHRGLAGDPLADQAAVFD